MYVEDDSRSRPTKDAEKKAPVSRQTVNATEIVHKMLISLRASDQGMHWVGSIQDLLQLIASEEEIIKQLSKKQMKVCLEILQDQNMLGKVKYSLCWTKEKIGKLIHKSLSGQINTFTAQTGTQKGKK